MLNDWGMPDASALTRQDHDAAPRPAVKALQRVTAHQPATQRALKRVMLVLPPTGPYCREDRCQSYFSVDLVPSMRPPLEEVEAAAGIKCAGGEAAVIDAPALGLDVATTIDRVVRFAPDAVVLSATFGSLADDVAFAQALRGRLPRSSLIGLRGAPVYAYGAELLDRHPCVDFLIHGEPELAFAELSTRGLAGAGVIRRGHSNAPAPWAPSLDVLPRADRTVIEPSLYRVRGTFEPQATVHVQRGCPFPCSYCLVGTVSGKKARHRDPDDVARELAELTAQGIRYFYLRAETLTLDRQWARELGAAIAARAPKARWVSATRVETADRNTLAALARGGCYGLSFGVETGSAEIGRRINKPPSLARATEAFRSCDELNIASLMYVVVGFFWETAVTLEETRTFVEAARPDLLTVYWAHPYPGTAYHRQLEELGIVSRSQHAQAEPALEPHAISTAEVRRWVKRLLRAHHLRPSVLWSVLKKLTPRLLPHPGTALAYAANQLSPAHP
ncbi:MAG: radical SAM protein [Myxococcaceae bacterium]|nr:radical SAM protein [Myxococcaceae bacterium]